MLDAFAEVTGCDRAALGELVGHVPAPESLTAHDLIDRVAAQERLAQAAQAAQACDLAALAESVDLDRPAELSGTTQKALVVEVAAALGCAALTARAKVFDATRAVAEHRPLLDLLGTGAVSMAGLRKVLDATAVLEPEKVREVADQLAEDARVDALTPGQLGKAAWRRVVAVDPEAAAKRARAARRNRDVRLGDPVDGTAGIFARLRAEEALAVFKRLDKTARGMRHDGDERSLDTLRADLFVEWLTSTRMVTPAKPAAAQAAAGAADGNGGQPSTGTSTTPSHAGDVSERDDRVPAWPTWRSIDGYEPWWWSEPPPRLPDTDPAPDDPAWDHYLDEAPDITDPPGDPPGDLPPSRPPDRRLPVGVELQVVVSAAALLGLTDDPALLRGYGAVPREVVADLIDAARATGALTSLRGLFCDPVDGRLVAMEQSGRFFTGALRDFELYRDQDCRLTGGTISDIDHRQEVQDGGGTTGRNGQGLGKLAHVVKDHPDVVVEEVPLPRRGDGLDILRVHAPDVEWQLPSGHRYQRRPPPALGHGSRRHARPDPNSVVEQRFAKVLREAA